MFGLIYDHKLVITPSTSGEILLEMLWKHFSIQEVNPCFLIEEKIIDSDLLSVLVNVTIKRFPKRKPKRKKEK